MHRDSCSTLSLAFIYDSFLLPIIPGTRAPRGSYEARRGGAEVGWHLICSMVVIYWMSLNPDWMKNGAQRRWGVPYSSFGGGKLPTSCPKNTPSFYIMPSFFLPRTRPHYPVTTTPSSPAKTLEASASIQWFLHAAVSLCPWSAAVRSPFSRPPSELIGLGAPHRPRRHGQRNRSTTDNSRTLLIPSPRRLLLPCNICLSLGGFGRKGGCMQIMGNTFQNINV